MQALLCLSLIAVIWGSQLGSAYGEEPKLVIKKAMAAHGGSERLVGFNAIRTQTEATVNPSADVPFTWNVI